MKAIDLLVIDLGGPTFSVEFEDGYAVRAAESAEWMIGFSKLWVADWAKGKGGKVHHVYPEGATDA